MQHSEQLFRRRSVVIGAIALAAGLAAGASLLEAARDAVRVGAFSVTGVGTQASYPTLDDELPAAAAAPTEGSADADSADGVTS
jgi:ribokinase